MTAPVANAADDTWGANGGTAWYTATNWQSGTQFPGLQGVAASNTDIATFSSAATATTFGINMNTASLNLGAIVFNSTRTTATNIGNSSSLTPGSLRLYGATTNSVANTILWNAGTGAVTLQATQAGGGTMGVVLGNTTNVIQITGSGGITISSNISEINSGSGLRVQGGGGGTLVLSGTNTYTGVTTIVSGGTIRFATVASLYNSTASSWTAGNINVSGTLALNVGGSGQFTTANVTTLLTNLGGLGGAVTNNGLRSGSRIAFDTTNAAGGNFTVADIIANSTGTGGGAIGLTKIGNNVLTLSASNSFTGGVTVSGGTLVLSNTNSYTGGTSVTSSTLRMVTGGAGTGTLTFNAGTLASVSASPLTVSNGVFLSGISATTNFGDGTGTGAITLAGGLGLSASGTGRTVNTVADVNVTGILSGSNSTFLIKSGAATLTLSNVGGTVTGPNNIIVTAGTLAVTRLSNSTVNSSIGRTTVAATVASITIDGGALNYIDGGGAASSTDRLLQIGRTTTGGTGTIRNNATSSTETVTFSNTNAILYGTVDQTRTLNLGGTNTGSNTLASPINNNGTGAVTVTKQDAGTWVLSATNTYTGTTTVLGGTLAIGNSGSLATGSAVTVGGGTAPGTPTLAGTGTVNGPVTISGTDVVGTLSPGLTSPGILTLNGATTLQATSNLFVKLNGATAGTLHDQIAIGSGGSIDVSGSNLTGTLGFVPNNADLFFIVDNQSASPVTGTFASGSTVTIGDHFFDVSYVGNLGTLSTTGGNDIVLFNATPVPEPSTILAIAGAVLGLGRCARRRKNQC